MGILKKAEEMKAQPHISNTPEAIKAIRRVCELHEGGVLPYGFASRELRRVDKCGRIVFAYEISQKDIDRFGLGLAEKESYADGLQHCLGMAQRALLCAGKANAGGDALQILITAVKKELKRISGLDEGDIVLALMHFKIGATYPNRRTPAEDADAQYNGARDGGIFNYGLTRADEG